jgi:hypothetical protein
MPTPEQHSAKAEAQSKKAHASGRKQDHRHARNLHSHAAIEWSYRANYGHAEEMRQHHLKKASEHQAIHAGRTPTNEAVMTNFVELADQKKASEFQNQLESALAEKVAAALVDQKVVVAQKLFGEETINEETGKTNMERHGFVHHSKEEHEGADLHWYKHPHYPKHHFLVRSDKHGLMVGNGEPGGGIDTTLHGPSAVPHYLHHHKVNEETLNEISKKTLGSYVKKASRQMNVLGQNHVKAHGKTWDKVADKTYNRDKGIQRAVDRLTK